MGERDHSYGSSLARYTAVQLINELKCYGSFKVSKRFIVCQLKPGKTTHQKSGAIQAETLPSFILNELFWVILWNERNVPLKRLYTK